MSRINEIIASMPPGVAAAVVHLREVHSQIMLEPWRLELSISTIWKAMEESSVIFHVITKELTLKVKRLTWKLTSVILIEYIKSQNYGKQ